MVGYACHSRFISCRHILFLIVLHKQRVEVKMPIGMYTEARVPADIQFPLLP